MTLRKSFSQSFFGQSVPQVWPFVEPREFSEGCMGNNRPGEHLSRPVGPCHVLVGLEITEVSHPLSVGAPQHDPYTVQPQRL